MADHPATKTTAYSAATPAARQGLDRVGNLLADMDEPQEAEKLLGIDVTVFTNYRLEGEEL